MPRASLAFSPYLYVSENKRERIRIAELLPPFLASARAKKHLGKWGVRINIAEFLPLFLRLGTNEKSLMKSEK